MRVVNGLMKSSVCFLLLACFSGIGYAGQTEQPTSSECLDCHDIAPGEIGGDYDKAMAGSVHSAMECLDCHAVIVELPHEENLLAVNCGECHEEEADTYQWHGRLRIPNGEDVPACADCHGKHDIRPSTDQRSRVHPINLPETCGRGERHIAFYPLAIQNHRSIISTFLTPAENVTEA